MRPDRLRALEDLERWHFWFAGRRALVERLLARHLPKPALVADLGCGTGANLALLRALGHRAAGLDLGGAPDIRADAARLPLRAGALDAVLLLDVLEHADDAAVLAEAARALRPGGLALIAVPAHPWLWSFRDQDAGHLRRYTRAGLLAAVRAAGLELIEVRPYQALLLPVLALARLLGRRGPALRDAEERLPRPVNALLREVLRLEAALPFALPTGSSLFCVARRSGTPYRSPA